MEKKFGISKSKGGLPTISVGGGAYTNTFGCRFILDSQGNLKRAIFIKSHGDLACGYNQAIVHVSVDDVIVEFSGSRPAWNPENPDTEVKQYRIKRFDPDLKNTFTEEVNDGSWTFPDSVLEGADIYHNRDGSYFVSN